MRCARKRTRVPSTAGPPASMHCARRCCLLEGLCRAQKCLRPVGPPGGDELQECWILGAVTKAVALHDERRRPMMSCINSRYITGMKQLHPPLSPLCAPF